MKEKVKEYLFNKEGKFIQQRAIPHTFSKKFPKLFEQLKENFKENLYNYLYEKEKPKCSICGKQVKFKNFKEGYRKYCSNKCVNTANSQSDTFSKKISNSRQKLFNVSYYNKKYDNVNSKDSENFILSNGKIINKNKYNRLKNFTLDDTKESFILNYETLKYKATENWCKDYIPNTLKQILNHSIESADFNTLKFMFVHDLKEIPLCKICNKNKVKFAFKGAEFNETCNLFKCRVSSSIFEQEVFKFIESYYDSEILQNYRDDRKEIDVFLPELSLGFECNGLYWHSELHKQPKYHQDKLLFFKEKGIQIFMIWEDDWKLKKDLIKSMIINKLGKSKNKLFARKLKVNEVSKKDSTVFLQSNHLQGNCVDKYRLGLYNEDMLVSIMTFGKRSIMKHEEMELLRFASLKNYNVIGGAGKLLSYFIKQNNPSKILSFANLDISNGNLYEKLMFKQISITSPGYWWSTNKQKFHRANFMKHKLINLGFDKDKTEIEIMHERGFFKIWDSGNIKFEIKL